MKVTFWGTRGSVASPGPETMRYGGNTSSLSVMGRDGTCLALDAGTGIRRFGQVVPASARRVDILLTHLHMDHIQGLGFFGPLYDPDREVHIWGPELGHTELQAQLVRYLSPPLFPVRLRDLPCKLHVQPLSAGVQQIGEFTVHHDLVCHPDPTLGYRIEDERGSVTYLPDHEPALGVPDFPGSPAWTSGYALAHKTDVLIHDAQYTAAEYPNHVGWGHSSQTQAIEFARITEAKKLVLFHHDPGRTDDALEANVAKVLAETTPDFPVCAAYEGLEIEIG